MPGLHILAFFAPSRCFIFAEHLQPFTCFRRGQSVAESPNWCACEQFSPPHILMPKQMHMHVTVTTKTWHQSERETSWSSQVGHSLVSLDVRWEKEMSNARGTFPQSSHTLIFGNRSVCRKASAVSSLPSLRSLHAHLHYISRLCGHYGKSSCTCTC